MKSSLTAIRIKALWVQTGNVDINDRISIIGLMLEDYRLTYMVGTLRDLPGMAMTSTGAKIDPVALLGKATLLIGDFTIHSALETVHTLTSPERAKCPLRLRMPKALELKRRMEISTALPRDLTEPDAGKKYELATDLTPKTYAGQSAKGGPYRHTMYRIRALRDINGRGVTKGDLGGWVEREYNLSQFGDCWVFDDAQVRAGARVEDEAMMMKASILSGKSLMQGHATVTDEVTIDGNCIIRDSAYISERAVLSGRVHVEDQCHVAGNAKLKGTMTLKDDTWVGEHCDLQGRIVLTGRTTIEAYARINGTGSNGITITNSDVGDDSHIEGHVTLTSGSSVRGSAKIVGALGILNKGIVLTHSTVEDMAKLAGSMTIAYADVENSAHIEGHGIKITGTEAGRISVSDMVSIKGDNIIVNARVRGMACIKTGAEILIKGDVVTFTGFGSEHGTLTAYRSKDGSTHVSRGCFVGTLARFIASVNKEYGAPQVAADWDAEYKRYWYSYMALVNVIKFHFSENTEPQF